MSQNNNMQVDPWTVTGTVDYMKLIDKFGTSPINGELLKRWEHVTKMPLHHFLRRGIVFSHQDLEKILDQKEAGILYFCILEEDQVQNQCI